MWCGSRRWLGTSAALGINKPRVMRHGFRIFKNKIPSVAEMPKEETRPRQKRFNRELYPKLAGVPQWYSPPWRKGPEWWDNPLHTGPDLVASPDSPDPRPIYSTETARKQRLHQVELAREAVAALAVVREAERLADEAANDAETRRRDYLATRPRPKGNPSRDPAS